MVQTDCADADCLQVLCGIQNIAVNLRIDAHDEHIRIRDLANHLFLGERLPVGSLNVHELLQLLGNAGINSVCNQALHRFFPPVLGS